MEPELLSGVLAMSLRRWPLLILFAIGLWFARSRRQGLGRASFWATWGFALLVVHSLAAYGLDVAFALERMSDGRASRLELAEKYALLNLLVSVLFVTGLAFVTRAVFAGRFPGRGPETQLAAH